MKRRRDRELSKHCNLSLSITSAFARTLTPGSARYTASMALNMTTTQHLGIASGLVAQVLPVFSS